MKITLDTYIDSGPLIKVGSSFVPASQTVNLSKNLLNNHDFMIPADALDKGTRMDRAARAFEEIQNNLNRMYDLDKANFENLKKEKPELQVNGVWPPMPITNTQVQYNNTMEMLKNWFKTSVSGWAAIFKAAAEGFAKAGNAVSTDREIERMKLLEPLANQVSDFYQNKYPAMYQKIINDYMDQQKKYQQAVDDREAMKLLEESKKAREKAEALTEQAKVLEQQNKPVEAKAATQMANQLNKTAEQKEILADSKMPKSKVGIALALAAAGALILASQE